MPNPSELQRIADEASLAGILAAIPATEIEAKIQTLADQAQVTYRMHDRMLKQLEALMQLSEAVKELRKCLDN